MTIDAGLKPEGAPERSPIAGAGVPRAVVPRLLRGEPLEVVAREANVSVAKLTEWRERALAGAAAALKERERDDREDEIARLKSKVGEITMDNELLSAKIAAMEIERFGSPTICAGAIDATARLSLRRSSPRPSSCGEAESRIRILISTGASSSGPRGGRGAVTTPPGAAPRAFSPALAN
jgi:hypothetical protein